MVSKRHFSKILARVSYIALTVISLCACDGYNYVDYNVINSTSSSVKVTFSQREFKDSLYIGQDTIIYLSPNESHTLSTRMMIGGGVWNPEDGNDTIWEFPRLDVYITDTIHSIDSLRSMKYWDYKNISVHHAELTLRAIDEYFQ